MGLSHRGGSGKGGGRTVVIGGVAPFKEFRINANQNLPVNTSSPLNYFQIGEILDSDDPQHRG